METNGSNLEAAAIAHSTENSAKNNRLVFHNSHSNGNETSFTSGYICKNKNLLRFVNENIQNGKILCADDIFSFKYANLYKILNAQ